MINLQLFLIFNFQIFFNVKRKYLAFQYHLQDHLQVAKVPNSFECAYQSRE